MTQTLPVVIPASAGSPWLAEAMASCGDAPVYVVGEGAEAQSSRAVVVPATAGFSARANAGLRRAFDDGHDAALLLNDDAALEPGAMAALAAAVSEPGVGVAGGVLMEWDGGVQLSGIACSRPTARVRVQTADVAPGWHDRRAVSGAAMAIDRAAWEAVGGLAEVYDFYLEDVDVCLAVAAAGWRVGVVGEARVRHRGGGTRSRRSPEAAHQLGRSHAVLSRRLGGPWPARAFRGACAAAAGVAWSARSVGVAGPAAFLRGFAAGATGPAGRIA